MSADLGTYEGLPILSHALKVVNTGDGLSRAMSISPTEVHAGDDVDLLMRAAATNVTWKLKSDDDGNPLGWIREQTLSAETVVIVDRVFSDEKIDAQRHAEAVAKERDDERKGIVKLPGTKIDKGEVVRTDGNGVVLTEAEYAERVGAGLPVHEVAAVVVEYDDGEKVIWPFDFDKSEPRPRVGDDGVVSVVDYDTGAPVVESIADELAAARDLGLDVSSIEGGDDDALTDVAAGEDETQDVSPAVDDFEDPDRVVPEPRHFAMLEGNQQPIRDLIAGLADVDDLRCLAVAEKQRDVRKGSGRAPILVAINARIVELERI